MKIRRWRDPRTGRVWEVGSCATLRSSPAPEGWSVLCFVSTGTPRNGQTIHCCRGVAGALEELDDQSLALCLDASGNDGFLWLDPRNRRLWWVREEERAGGTRHLRFTGSVGEVDVDGTAPLETTSPGALAGLLDRAGPATAA